MPSDTKIDPVGCLAYIRNCLRRRGRSRADAEDLVQEAFLRMELYCRAGREVRDAEAFLMRTALNLSASQGRRDVHAAAAVELEEQVHAVVCIPAVAPDEVVAVEERLERIGRTLDAVSRRTREIFLMHRLGGYTYEEIARTVGLSVSAVEKYIASGAAALAIERQRSG